MTVSFIVTLGQDRANDQEHRSIATRCRCSDPAGARSRAPDNQGWKKPRSSSLERLIIHISFSLFILLIDLGQRDDLFAVDRFGVDRQIGPGGIQVHAPA